MRRDSAELRDALNFALKAGKVETALEIVESLEQSEPYEPSWPHRRGDLCRRLGRRAEAVAAFERAVNLYSKKGLVARAVAMAKTLLQLDPRRTDILGRLENESARALHRRHRPSAPVGGRMLGAEAFEPPTFGPMLDLEPKLPKRPPPPQRVVPAGPQVTVKPISVFIGTPAAASEDKTEGIRLPPRMPVPTPAVRPAMPAPAEIVKGRPESSAEELAGALASIEAPPASMRTVEAPPPSKEVPAARVEERLSQGVSEPETSTSIRSSRLTLPSYEEQRDTVAAPEAVEVDLSSAPPPPVSDPFVLRPSEAAALGVSQQASAPPEKRLPPPIPSLPGAEAFPSEPTAPRVRDTDEIALASPGTADLLPPIDPHMVDLGGLRSVPPLAPARDQDADEVRFEDAVEGPEFLIELSEHEVVESRLTDEATTSMIPAASEDRLAALPLFALFAEAPSAAVSELAAGADLIELPDGAPVTRKGDPADALFAIVEGAARLEGADKPIILEEGDVFGESCLLAGEKRTHDAFAHKRLVALRIHRDLIARVTARYPVMGELLFELLARRLLANLLKTSPLFLVFDLDTRVTLARQFHVRRAPRGTVLLESGKRSDGLYIPLTGALIVEKPGARQRELGPGAILGQQSLLSRAPSDVTVRAAADMAVLRLPAAQFMQVAMQYPPVLAYLAEAEAEPIGAGTNYLG